MPSACPITLHDFSSLPLVVYSLMVLGLVVEPSLAELFCQAIHTLSPTTLMSSGWFAAVVAPANRQTLYPGRAATLESCEAVLQPLLLAEVVLAVLLVELLEQAETASPSTAAAAAYLVSFLNVLTG